MPIVNVDVKKPFHVWKDEQVKKDFISHGVYRYYREQDWYWKQYGKYVNAYNQRRREKS